jgi:hypothetical protein
MVELGSCIFEECCFSMPVSCYDCLPQRCCCSAAFAICRLPVVLLVLLSMIACKHVAANGWLTNGTACLSCVPLVASLHIVVCRCVALHA